MCSSYKNVNVSKAGGRGQLAHTRERVQQLAAPSHAHEYRLHTYSFLSRIAPEGERQLVPSAASKPITTAHLVARHGKLAILACCSHTWEVILHKICLIIAAEGDERVNGNPASKIAKSGLQQLSWPSTAESSSQRLCIRTFSMCFILTGTAELQR